MITSDDAIINTYVFALKLGWKLRHVASVCLQPWDGVLIEAYPDPKDIKYQTFHTFIIRLESKEAV